MKQAMVDQLRAIPTYSRLSEADLTMLAAVSTTRLYTKGEQIFRESDPADSFHMIVRGRVKIFKETPAGKDLILALLGPGDPVGAVAVYMETPFPATAEAIEDTICVQAPSSAFYELLDRSPSLVRGLLLGLTHRLMELTGRLAVLTGTRVESRFARLFLKLSEETGRPTEAGTRIPVQLSRQELADLTGTTIETCIRIMSRWRKGGVVITDEAGFLVPEIEALRSIAHS